MKKFIIPEIEIRDLSPSQSVMDDITGSGEIPGFAGIEQVVSDPGASDEAIW